jgi:hypothetical protein
MSVIIIPQDNSPCDKTCVTSLIIAFSSVFGAILVVVAYFICGICIIPNVMYIIHERRELKDQIICKNVSSFISSNEPDTDLEMYRKFNTYINERQLKGCSFGTFCKIRKSLIEML